MPTMLDPGSSRPPLATDNSLDQPIFTPPRPPIGVDPRIRRPNRPTPGRTLLPAKYLSPSAFIHPSPSSSSSFHSTEPSHAPIPPLTQRRSLHRTSVRMPFLPILPIPLITPHHQHPESTGMGRLVRRDVRQAAAQPFPGRAR